MFKALKLIKNLIFLLLFISSVSAHAEEQSLAEPQKPGQSQEIQTPSQEIPSLQQKQKISFFNSQNFNFKEKRIFSLDTAYLLSGLKNNGWGLGLGYEQLVLPFLSIKSDFSHVTIFPTSYDLTITTVGISLNAFYYPLNKGLNFLYIGFGCRTDFLMYSGDDVPSDHKKDSLIRLARFSRRHQKQRKRIRRKVKIQPSKNIQGSFQKIEFRGIRQQVSARLFTGFL